MIQTNQALANQTVNLAGGATSVTGALPDANQAAQTMTGDVTGTTAASVVAKAKGATLPTSPVTGDVGKSLVVSAADTYVLGDNRSLLFGWAAVTLGSTTSTQYVQFGATTANVAATEATSQVLMPRAGKIVTLYAALRSAKLATANLVLVVRKATPSGDPPWAGSDSSLTCTLNAGTSVGSDTNRAHALTFAAGDLISISSTTSASDGTSSRLEVSLLVEYG